MLFRNFILHTFKKFKFKFYHSTKGIPSHFALALLYKVCPVDYLLFVLVYKNVIIVD